MSLSFPLSPPHSTSLPSHDTFPPPWLSDPPPTDGPNTRDRARRGLKPKSGTLFQEGTRFRFENENGTASGLGLGLGDSTGSQGSCLSGWNDLNHERGEKEKEKEEEFFPPSSSSISTYEPFPSDYYNADPGGEDLSFSSSTTTETSSIFIDDPFTTSAAFEAGPRPPHANESFSFSPPGSENVFNFYPPPPPMVSQLRETGGGNDRLFEGGGFDRRGIETNRVVSNATIIEYPSTSTQAPEAGDEEQMNELGLSTTSSLNGLGITKEEWLRLGGFPVNDLSYSDIPTRREQGQGQGQGEEDVFIDSTSITRNFNTSSSSSSTPFFTLPPPPLPLPAQHLYSNSRAHSTFVLPHPKPPSIFPPTPIPDDSISTTFSPLILPPPSAGFELPTPPERYHRPQPHSRTSNSITVSPWSTCPPPLRPPSVFKDIPISAEPMNELKLSQRDASPPKSPRKKRPLPTPYPSVLSSTTSSSSSSALPGQALGRNLTPVTSALFTSAHSLPAPTNLSETVRPSSGTGTGTGTDGGQGKGEKEKKSHSRKVSEGHIKRPRNAFILFRSHLVNSGTLPKTTTVFEKRPKVPPSSSSLITPNQDPQEDYELVEVIKPVDHKNVSKIVGSIWRGLSKEEKRVWEELAEKEKREHGEKYPGYKYRPKSRAGERKRRVGKKVGGDEIEEEEEGEDGTVGVGTRTRTKSEKGTGSREGTMEAGGGGGGGDKNRAHLGDILVNDDSPISSTASTVHQSPPVFFENKTPTKQTQHLRIGSSPTVSSASSPPSSLPEKKIKRMHPYPRPPSSAASTPSPTKKHPLSRSQTLSSRHDQDQFSTPSRSSKSKTIHYIQAGLGVSLPTTPPPPPPPITSNSNSTSNSDPFFFCPPPDSISNDPPSLGGIKPLAQAKLDQIPLFTGKFSTDSRQFSLGRWELRKPSPFNHDNISPSRVSSTSTVGLMDRSLSRPKEEELDEKDAQGKRISSALVLDPRQFLTDSGLFPSTSPDHDHEQGRKEREEEEEEGETYSVWDDSSSSIVSTSYSSITAPTTVDSVYSRSAGASTVDRARGGGGIGGTEEGGKTREDEFHFGTMNLFEKPPNALVGREGSGLFPKAGGTKAGDGGVGLGIDFGGKWK
ncbi:uncharacterized protein JCM6883_006844 [Sporobolomyces salmoneus]|uniref:uncharacterized protein n=1 Tax=Sporobolomyces salmoneus TaxID=183962 RepID=UPI00317B03BE